MKIGIIGAGQTGRGFLARLLAPYAEILFTDKNDTLCSTLSGAGTYTVRFFGGTRAAETIQNYRAVPMDAAGGMFDACGAVLISVRAENAPDACAWLAKHAPHAVPVLCENASRPAMLAEASGLRAASGAVFCTTVADGTSLDIESEDYPSLFVSRENCPTALAALPGITAVDDFDTLMKRKIYTYNAASAVIAYLGASRGMTEYADAANDGAIAAALDGFYREVNRAIFAEYGVDAAEQEQFALLSKKKFQNRAIRDTVARNAASPERKLGARERILEPIRLIEKHGGDASVLYDTAAAALRCAGAKTKEDAKTTLLRASSLPASDTRIARILARF